MASPGSRWQLLLMADDGRILPFRRIKGLLLAFLVLLLILGVVCVGIGWWLVSEMVHHEQAKARLVELESQLARCIKDRESSISTPVTSEAQVKDAQSPERKSFEPISSPPLEPMDNLEPAPDTMVGQVENDEKPLVQEKTTPLEKNDGQSAENFPAEISKAAPPEAIHAKVSAPATIPVIILGDALKVTYAAENKVLKVQFRIKNSGPRSSPVRGRCVAVLKADGSDPDTWLSMPQVTLVNGEPTGKRGRRFKISRYMDMTVEAAGAMAPSNFSTATIYVFDNSGDKIVEKIYPVQR